MYWSSRNTTLIGRPLLGSAANAFSIPNAGEWRSTRPTWLTTPASLDRCGHLGGRRQVDRQRLLAEHGQPSLGRRRHQPGMLGRPGADVDGVARVEDLVLRAAHRGPCRQGELLGPLLVGVVHAGPRHVRSRDVQRLGVVRGDQPRPQEPHPRRHGRTVAFRATRRYGVRATTR